MMTTRLTLGLVGVVAVSGIAASLVIEHSEHVTLREKAEAFRQRNEQIARLSAENERLSNTVARAQGPQSLAPNQLRELLRLRGQIGPLRRAAQEQAQLQAANAQLRATLAASERQLAEARAAPNFWAKDQLAFAGYAEPEAALETALWAMKNGDMKTYLAASVSGPEASAHLESELGEKAEAELAAEGKGLAESLDPSIGFHILDKKVKSADQVILNLSFDGEGKARKFVMQRTGNEWKVTAMLSPGEAEP
jgi:cell division protein FtsB